MNNKTHSIITSILFLILFIGLFICAHQIYTINKELDTANKKITKYAIFLNKENVQSLKKEIDTSDWEKFRIGSTAYVLAPQEWKHNDDFGGISYCHKDHECITIQLHGVPLDGGADLSGIWEGVIHSSVSSLFDEYDVCETIIDDADNKLLKCHKLTDEIFTQSYIKIGRNVHDKKNTVFEKTTLTVTCTQDMHCSDEENTTVKTIFTHATIDDKPFIPSS